MTIETLKTLNFSLLSKSVFSVKTLSDSQVEISDSVLDIVTTDCLITLSPVESQSDSD